LLFVERSNRTERLLDGLAGRLAEPVDHPLAPSVIVVQGPGMERWLAQEIARRHGICANVDFCFPRAFADRLFEAFERTGSRPPRLEADPWAPASLPWAVARGIAEHIEEPDFAPLARYLAGGDAVWRRLQLARRVARLFTDYITYRPEWVEAWSAGQDAGVPADARWQPRLFRTLTQMLGPDHFARRALEFTRGLERADTTTLVENFGRVYPGGIEIFAVSTLAPLYLSVLDGFARVRDVHLSVLSPSRGYWADLWQEVREADRAAAMPVAMDDGLDQAMGWLGEGAAPSRLFAQSGVSPAARLLGGLGRLGADFQRSLEERTSTQAGDDDRFDAPRSGEGPPSLLQRLQADLLDPEEIPDPKAEDRQVAATDDSIRIHVCHGRRRELEVVEGVLRDAFERDPTLRPEDVIVMAPRIDEAAPDIDAVFGAAQGDPRAIPYRIADRGALRRSLVADCYAALLGLLTSRITRSEWIDWLAREPAREQFELAEVSIEGLEEWSRGAGVRFGLDAKHRADLGLAEDDAHTWSDALARLALAHAVGPSDEIFAGTAAAPLGAFLPASTLGSLGAAVDLLVEARGEITRARSVPDWCAWLTRLLERSCHRSDANAHEHTRIRGWLQEISTASQAVDFGEDVPFEAIRESVLEQIESSPAPQAFLAGGVTFCELVPLRAIPFRVVVLLGLVDTAFPRGQGAPGYDLIARSPRAGDRNARLDDRHLFLEALLSARDRLVLTVPGRDLRDGTDLSPSIVVSELLDTIEASYSPDEAASGKSLRERLQVKHPLHAFSARYFEADGDLRPWARNAEAFAGARARARVDRAERRFLDMLAPRPMTLETPHLTLDALSDRLRHATRTFTRDRLGVRLPDPGELEAEHDPVVLAGLERYSVGSVLIEELLAGADPEHAFARLRARATLPSGFLGELETRSLHSEIQQITQIVRARRGGDPRADHDFELALEVPALGTVQLVGRLDRLSSTGRVVADFTKIGKRSELDLWIRHLALCACVERRVIDVAPLSVLVARPEKTDGGRVVELAEVVEPRQVLAQLFEWAWSLDRAPLPFFPETSRKFAISAEKNLHDARRQAYQAYHGGDWGTPEGARDLADARLWEGFSPLDSDASLPVEYGFEALATTFFAPLLRARTVRPQ
jgi:exodeoxyribonuclease V gamma subunit